MAVKAPYFSLTGSQAELVRKDVPNSAIASRAPENTVIKMASKTVATRAARPMVRLRKPPSSSFSDIGRRLRV